MNFHLLRKNQKGKSHWLEFTCIVFFLWITTLSFCQNPSSKEEIYNKIQESNEKGNQVAILENYIELIEFFLHNEFNEDSIKHYYFKGKKIAEDLSDEKSLAQLKMQRAGLFSHLGNYVEAMELYLELEPEIESNQYQFAPFFYDSFAHLYYRIKDYPNSFKMLKKEASIFETQKDTTNLAAVYNNLGILYKNQSQIDSSLFYHFKSQAINEERKDTINIIKSYNNIGNTYLENNELRKAEEYFKKGFEFDPEKASIGLLLNYADVSSKNKNYKLAENLIFQVLENPSSDKVNQVSAYEKLIQSKISQNDYKSAYDLQVVMNNIQEEVIGESKLKEIERLKAFYSDQEKQLEIITLKAENEAKSLTLERNRWLMFSGFLFSFFIALFSYFIVKYRTNKLSLNTLLLEQKLLRSQMNPHFIFNSLSSIQTNILKRENEKAIQYLSKFSRLIRKNMENTFKNSVSLSREIELLKDYLGLQNIRLENELEYEIIFSEDLEPELIFIPPMLIQPLVENAIEHGNLDKKDVFTIQILLSENNERVCCKVLDNGIGLSNALKNTNQTKESMSSHIIKERLLNLSKQLPTPLHYKVEDIIDETGNISGTMAYIELPILDDNPNKYESSNY